jgi:hypothetical protein
MQNIPSYENFLAENAAFDISLNEAYYAGYEDSKRISDIITKANGSGVKELQLAQTMANKITGYEKAIARAEAAIDLKKYEIAQIFAIKAAALPKTDNRIPLNSVELAIEKYMSDKRNKENYEAHLKGIEGKPDANPDGVFFNVGIPILHKQKDADSVNMFRHSITRIVQNLAGQQHVYVMPMSYDEAKQILVVRISPNFTYPKGAVQKAFKEYPKLLADYLNKAYGEDVIKAKSGEIMITKDINYKVLIASVVLTDIKHGNLKLKES